MIAITPSGFTLSEPLVAGEPVAVSVSGFSLAEGAALSLVASACKANYQLAVASLAEGDGGAWTGTLDTATTAASLFFAGASACESRGIRLELVDTAHRDSLAALCCPLQNSTLIPALNPQAVPPVYLATPGPPGAAATVEVGETTTLPAGSPATVENVGTASAPVLNFGIPAGPASFGLLNQRSNGTMGQNASWALGNMEIWNTHGAATASVANAPTNMQQTGFAVFAILNTGNAASTVSVFGQEFSVGVNFSRRFLVFHQGTLNPELPGMIVAEF